MTVSASNQRGLAILRKTTSAYIADDPVTIALNVGKAGAVEQPSGGYLNVAGDTRDPQTFKMIGANNDGSALSDNDGATTASREYWLVGEWDALVSVGDWWVDGGCRYTVVELTAENGYERKVRVNCQGLEPNYG